MLPSPSWTRHGWGSSPLRGGSGCDLGETHDPGHRKGAWAPGLRPPGGGGGSGTAGRGWPAPCRGPKGVRSLSRPMGCGAGSGGTRRPVRPCCRGDPPVPPPQPVWRVPSTGARGHPHKPSGRSPCFRPLDPAGCWSDLRRGQSRTSRQDPGRLPPALRASAPAFWGLSAHLGSCAHTPIPSAACPLILAPG